MAPGARLLALTGVAVVLAGVGLLGWSLGSGGPSAGPDANVPGSMAPATGPASTPASTPAGAATTEPTDPTAPADPTASAGSATRSPDDVPTTAPPRGATEVLPSPSTTASGGNPYLPDLPAPGDQPASLLTEVPEPATASGVLATGFPAALAPPEGSTIESSSLTVAGRRVQAALVADPRGGAKALLLHYRTVLGQRGFAEESVQAPENAPAAAFRHGEETVTVTLQDGVCYLLANLRVAS
ncbi:hypothetical protein [Nocardioides sp.]|uniref:hypothetical protein n=1 Tax=Nocardioides sp. TaxID=35761 RepID=UPI0039E23C1D